MGSAGSKDDPGNDQVYKFENIYYDEEGNLRHGRAKFKSKETKQKEMRDLMNLEDEEELDAEEEDVIWYVMDASWVAAWFAYVHYESDISPNPGPCRNERLLMPDYDLERWVPRPRLVMATKKRAGDYRRVSRKTWELYCALYPGSGPMITTMFKKDDNVGDSGLYPTSNWEIEEIPFPPDPTRKKVQHVDSKGNPIAAPVKIIKDQSELMEDKAITKNIQSQMEFLGTRKNVVEDEKKKKKKKKPQQLQKGRR